jgi:hypothetical protein
MSSSRTARGKSPRTSLSKFRDAAKSGAKVDQGRASGKDLHAKIAQGATHRQQGTDKPDARPKGPQHDGIQPGVQR